MAGDSQSNYCGEPEVRTAKEGGLRERQLFRVAREQDEGIHNETARQ